MKLEAISGDKVKCLLCPHNCLLGEGKSGICGVRTNSGGRIILETYGVISGFALDPVEKKPLYHYYPGSNILSIGSYGCNLKCDFCQNYHISQNIKTGENRKTGVGEIISHSLTAHNNIGIAFTYNEPVIWFELVRDVAEQVKSNGQHTAMVTNGYVTEEALTGYLRFIDAFNVDLKAFNNDFYKKLTGADLGPVLNSLKQIVKNGKHLEITTLVIPGKNDDTAEMENQVKWIAGELGRNVPFHLSRYFPMYKRDDPSTPIETLKRLYDIASKYLDYVYVGNTSTPEGQDTICSKCGTVITKRSGYSVKHQNVTGGNCSKCGTEIYRYFTFSSS